ncbi:MAG: hypothetical protein HZB44_01605 [Actinobacteria bacterium]|nr:hypothetical protein [Actinomycetota bacterium]
MIYDPKRIALRCFNEPEESEERKTRQNVNFPPLYALAFDTETTADETQRLNFGSWRIIRITWTGARKIKRVDTIKEGLLYADDLEERDPKGLAVLQNYVLSHSPDVTDGSDIPLEDFLEVGLEIDTNLGFHSSREFVNKLFYKWAYKRRLNAQAGYKKQVRSWVVGFNLPFDLSRLAIHAGEARDKKFAGGFSLAIWGSKRPNSHRPRLSIKNIDSKRALKGFMRHPNPDPEDLIPEGEIEPDPNYVFRGHFLDLRTLVFALTDKGHTLESAAGAFGIGFKKLKVEDHGKITPEYIDYNRRDVKLTAEIFAKSIEDYYRHPIELQPTIAYSPASIGKAYLRAMNITPILKRPGEFPKKALGHAMNAYYGGRAEAKVRRVSVPVVHTDFLSMYPTVNSLMDMWRFQIAERIKAVKDTNNVRRFVERVTLDDCFNPATWKELPALVLVEPDGEPFPVRVKYDEYAQSWQIGVNELRSKTPLWLTLPDVIAAKMLSGKTPKIKQAIRLVPVGKLKKLKPVKLGGQISIDPRSTDFFRTVIEERKSLPRRSLSDSERDRLDKFLKVLANSTSYGIFAETVRTELASKQRETVRVYAVDGETFLADVNAVEKPGEFSFPPVAACITGAARLMLALLERMVTDIGGTYAFCDTDSMAIVANKKGGNIPIGKDTVKALSWEEVDEIVCRFSSLNPYNERVIAGSVLEIEKENFVEKTRKRKQLYCYAISAKRYALFNLDSSGLPHLRKVSEHGLGHLLPPNVFEHPLSQLDLEADEDPSEEGRKTPSWIEEIWNHIVMKDGLGKEANEMTWLDRPAITRLAISSAHMRRPFESYNKGKTYQEQIKPFNFMLSAHVTPFGYPPGVDETRFQLVTRYSTDSKQWLRMKWLDKYSSKKYSVTTSAGASKTFVQIKTYGDVLEDYRAHPEAKSLGPDGNVCDRKTKGLLKRRPIEAINITYVGKESNRLEEVQAGLVHDVVEVLNELQDPRNDEFKNLVLPVIKEMPVQRLIDESGLSRRAIFNHRAGKKLPRDTSKYVKIAARYARENLKSVGIEARKNDLEAIYQYCEIQKR